MNLHNKYIDILRPPKRLNKLRFCIYLYKYKNI